MLGQVILRLIVNAVAIMFTAYLLPGIQITDTGFWPMAAVALILAIANAVIKPILMVLTCPFTLITLGLFIFVVNGLVLAIVAELSRGIIEIDNFGWAILGGIVISIVSLILESVLGIRDEDREARAED